MCCIIIFPKVVFANDFIIYNVQSGDSFATISRKCYGNISPFIAILQANHLREDIPLKEGQMLIIPYIEDYPFQKIQQEISSKHENKIDSFYSYYYLNTVSEKERLIVLSSEAEAWKNEMLHAYDLLEKKEYFETDNSKQFLSNSKESYLTFVENEAKVEAYCVNPNFSAIHYAYFYITEKQLYKQHTENLYSYIYKPEEAIQYIFNEEQTKKILENSLNENKF